jgi:hypothetical protein
VVVLVVAGCGGGGRLSKSQYMKHLHTDGQAITKAFAPLAAPPTSLSQFASQLKTGASKLRDAANDLDGISPPKSVEKDNAALVSDLRGIADELESLQKAAEKKDPTLVRTAVANLRNSKELVDARRVTDDLKKKGYTLGASQ